MHFNVRASPENTGIEILKSAFSDKRIAHLCIDFQEFMFASTDDPINLTNNKLLAATANKLLGHFRKLGIPNMVVKDGNKTNERNGKNYIIEPDFTIDLEFRKDDFSAFDDEDLLEELKYNQIDTILVSGLAYGVCVWETIKDALQNNLKLIIISDAVDIPSDPQWRLTQDWPQNVYMLSSVEIKRCLDNIVPSLVNSPENTPETLPPKNAL